MTFLDPLMLLGLAAAAIPVLLHLFNLRQPRRVDFSSLAFVKELKQSTMRRVRIKQWLLLALRVLAIACLVLAFARPTLTGGMAGTVGGRAAASFAVVIDNSLSMTLRDGQGAYLEQAKALAAGIVGEAAPGDEMFVLTTAGSGSETVPYATQAAALEAVQAVEAQAGASTLARAGARAAALLEEASHLNRELYLISDLQRSTLADSLADALPEGVRVVLLPVGEREHANVAVTGVQVASRIIEAGQPVRVQATLRNFGDEALEDYVASAYLEGERVAQDATDLPAGQEQTAEFVVTPQERGWLAGTIEIEDDAFPADNARYFTVHVPQMRQLLIVRGEGQRTRYVELALSEELTQGRLSFEAETIAEDALAGTPLGAYDAVALVGPQSLASGEREALARYVEEGGGLLFFPSAQARAEDYNALFGALGGGQFSGFSGEQGGERPVARFEQVDLAHPLFEGIFDQARVEEEQVESPEVYYAMNYAPRTGSEQTLIELSSGMPFLQEIRHGRGTALLMAVAPDPAWSDFPVRGLFIPLLYRSFYYLSAGEAAAGEQLAAGQAGTLRLTGVPEEATLRLVGPDGEERIPEQERVFGAVLLRAEESLRTPGIYEVLAGEELVRRVALNVHPRESDPAAYAPDAAAERLAEVTGREVRVFEAAGGRAPQIAEVLRQQEAGVEIWNVFLMAALAFLVAEMLVARQWQPETVSA